MAFQGGTGKQTLSTWQVLLPVKLLQEITKGQLPQCPEKEWSQSAHLQHEEEEEKTGMVKEQKRRKTPFSFKVRPLAGIPYKLHALYINLKYLAFKNYIRGCHNYKGQWAEGVNCYFYSYLNKGIPPNEQPWRMILHI